MVLHDYLLSKIDITFGNKWGHLESIITSGSQASHISDAFSVDAKI